MAAITSITESWNGHSFSEVESHIKSNYLPTTNVSVGSISSGVSSVLTLNSGNAVKKTSLSDLASLLGVPIATSYQGNVNNLTTPGFYLVWGGGDTSNMPNDGAGGFLWVFPDVPGDSRFVVQIAYDYLSKKLVTRYKWNSNTWTGWS